MLIAPERTWLYPEVLVDNVSLTRDFGVGGGWQTSAREILPANVVIHPKTGRGIFDAPASTLKHFVGLKGR